MTKINLDINSIYNGHFNITYRGIPMIKCPFDNIIYQMIINEIKPDLIIEIGTHLGGSALYMADILDLIYLNNYSIGKIHTIDIETRVKSELVINNNRIQYFSDCGYEGYDLKQTESFKNILVIDDGSHHYNDVKNSLQKFHSIVSLNSYFIIEDGGIIDSLDIRQIFGGGPIPAIHEFLYQHNNFHIDQKWINFFGLNSTFNSIGYLKKIK